MKFMVRTFISWLPLAVLITGMCMLVYTAVQQNYRQSLNDPQVQMAEDAARYLAKDYTPAAIVPRGQAIDIAQSLAPWIAVYDANGTPLESSGVLDGAPPQPPEGVFTDLSSGVVHGAGPKTVFKLHNMLSTGENRLSWQPRPDVRQAIVVTQIPNHGFVVAGRNMREVEDRIGDIGTMIGLGWIVLMGATFFAKAFARYFG